MSSPFAPQGPNLVDVDKLRGTIGRYFTVYETRATPVSLIFLINVNDATLESNFNQLAAELWRQNYVPQVRYEGGEHVLEVVRRPARKPWGGAVNWVMLGLTILTSVFAGAFLWVAYQGYSSFQASDLLWGAVFFAAPLLAILGLHELAHFVVARRHQVEASLPFFMPMPPPWVIFGTFGAFISLREPIPNKKALFDIGASGPIAGFLVAIPVTLAGLFLSLHSPQLPLSNCGPTFLGVPYGGIAFGTSLVWYGLGLFFPAALINLNPLAIAGWVGILITSINLLPAGQLDGGHVFRALLGKRSVWLSIAVVAALIALGFFYEGWFLFAFLIVILGIRHPPPLNDISPLDLKRKVLGVCAAIILVGGIALVPIADATGTFPSQGNTVEVSAYDQNATSLNVSFDISDQDFVNHSFYVYVTLTPSPGMSNTSITDYYGNVTVCAFSYGSTTIPCDLVVDWPSLYMYPAPIDVVAGGSTTVHLAFYSPTPTGLKGEIEVKEHCPYEDLDAGPYYYSFNYG